MTTRGRSKTADPGDLRKVARAHHAPRKFTEKIAMMKQREAQHAAAFAEVMSNIAQKTVGYGEDLGGSMPTLNHDFTNGSVKSIDLQLAFRDLSKVKSNASKARPRHLRRNWSSGSKTTADIDPYPMNLTHLNDSWLNRKPPSMKNNHWSFGGGLSSNSMHKSDSDLHQSLLQEQQAANLLPPYMGTQSLEYQPPIPVSNYMPTSVPMGYQPLKYNVDQSQRRGKLSDTLLPSSSLDYSMQQHGITRKRPSSTSSALASIEQYIPLSNDGGNTLQPLNVQSKISSSLPDLTNTNFYCGLDRPIDEDKPLENDGYLSNLGQKTQNQFYGQPQPKGYIASCLSNVSAPVPSSAGTAYSNIHCSAQSSSTINSLNVMSSLPGGTNSYGQQLPSSTSGAPISQPYTTTNPPFNNLDSKDILSSSGPSGYLSTALGKVQPTTDPVTLLLPSTTNTLSNRYAGTLFETKKVASPPSYTEHMRQTAVLQHKMASISMCNNDGEMLPRSHSDENLAAQKVGNLQQNPFMGNMMSASSVPSIYVESNEPVLFDYGLPIRNSPPDSPSESTTASYASSPPHLRPAFDHAISFHDAYYDWPLGGSDKLTDRSSLSHHKSLTELSMIAEEPHLQKPPLSHQLSLPSISIDNGKPMDQDMPGLNPFPMDDNELEFEADFSVLDNTQLPDLTSTY